MKQLWRRSAHRRRGLVAASVLTLLLLAAWAAAPARLEGPSARGLGLSSPLPAAERLFFTDFDDLDAHAEEASGSPAASCRRQLVASREDGARRGVLSLARGERCRYDAHENVRPEAGTLSFHVSAPSRAGHAGPERFLQLQSAGAEPFVLAIDTGGEPDTLRVLVKRGRAPDRVTHALHARVPWGEERWHRVDVSWRSDRLALHVDGAHAESLRVRDFSLPGLERGSLELLAGSHGEPLVLDELAIWSRALASAEIEQAFAATRGEPLAPPLVVAPRLATPFELDGRMDPQEWAEAALVPIAVAAASSFTAPRFAAARLAWDGAALHIGFASPPSDEAAEAFVLEIAPPGEPRREHRFRFANGALSYRGPAPAAPGRFADARDGEAWTLEAELPLAELAGEEPPVAGEWRLRLGRQTEGRRMLAGEVGWGAGGASAWGRLRLGADPLGVRVFASPALGWGEPAFELEGPPRWRARLRVEPEEGKAVERAFRLGEPVPALALPAAGSGLVELSVRDDDGDERFAWSAHISSRGVLDAPLVPDVAGRRLVSEIRSQDLTRRWRERLAAGALELAITATAPDGSRTESRAPLGEGARLYPVASSLAPGRHRLSYRFLTSDARVLWTEERELEVPDLSWAATPAGASEAVLEPWSPIRYEGPASAELWGRRYRLDGPLLSAVENQGRPLLRGPMRLELDTSAGRATLVSETSQRVEEAPARGEWRGRGAFGASGVGVEWSVTLEYDGLLLSSLTLEPPVGGIEVRSLRLDVPLRSDVVRYLRGTHVGPAIRSGRVPWDGRRWQSGFEPFVWLTNEREGFLYLSDSAANWVHREGARVVTVRGGEEAGLTLELIQGPLRLDRRVAYRLGFQATPVKPMLPDARAWNFGNFNLARGENALSWVVGWAVHDGVFEVADAGALRAFDRSWRRRGLSPFYYGATSATPALGATFRLFEDVWRSATAASFPGASAATELRGALPPHRMVGVCPAAESFQDLLLHHAERLVREHGVVGLYTDTDGLFADDNTLHGCGFEDAFGRRGPSFGILAKRRFARRMAAIVRHAGARRAYWMSHDHARLVPPISGFADFWYPGEELSARVAKQPWLYVDGLDPTAWRVEYRGESSGIAHVFLPELPSPPDPAASGAMLALAAVNDVNVAAAFSDRAAVGEYWTLRERLGLVDAEFVGHWDPACPVRVVAGSATASAYRTRQGWVLVVANTLARAQTLRLALARERLGSEPAEAVDARTGARLALRGDELELGLPARSYTFVSLSGGGGRPPARPRRSPRRNREAARSPSRSAARHCRARSRPPRDGSGTRSGCPPYAGTRAGGAGPRRARAPRSSRD